MAVQPTEQTELLEKFARSPLRALFWRSLASLGISAFAFRRSACHSEAVIVFALDGVAAFCVLQSRPHEIWARFFGSSMKDDLRYTPSDCFETFPFPRELGDAALPSKPPARPTTSSAPRSWSATTRA